MSRLAGLALLLVLLVVPEVRGWLESQMSLHMAVELPLLSLAGWMLGKGEPDGRSLLHRIDASGLFTATTVSCVLAAWMLPVALDLAILDPLVALLKYGTWVLAGAMLRASRVRSTPVIAAFFLANAAWMTATAGLLYLDADQQLCVNYLVNDQERTGIALMAWGAVLGGGALAVLRPLLAPATPEH